MKIKIHSIRFRLTFYFLLIFTGLLIVLFAIILYNFKTYTLSKAKNSLRDKSFVIGAWVDFNNRDFNVQVDDYIGSQDAELMIQLFDRDGNQLGHSLQFKGEKKLPEEARLAVVKMDEPYSYETEDYIVVVNNLFDNDQRKGFVQLFLAKKTILSNYNYLFRIVCFTGIGCLLIAFLAGLFLVDQMLDPINKIMNTVAKIRAEKLDATRLKVKNPNDEIGRLSITLNDLLDRIQIAVANQRKFLSDAAHELRTPLTILKGNTEVALLKKGPESLVLNKNLVEVDHLISLTNDLLLIARFDARTNVMHSQRIGFSEMVTSIISNFEIKAKGGNIIIHNHVKANIDILGDVALMKRVVYNLLDNAIKYSGNGLNVYIQLDKISEKYFQLIIRDEGIGISSEKLPLLFERFYRVAEDRNKNIEGTGLGLAIVKSIVELHDFQIKVESEVNKGSSFIVSGKIFE